MNFVDELEDLIDDAREAGVPFDDVMVALAEVLYTNVHDGIPALPEGKAMVITLKPFLCGCLDVSVTEDEPIAKNACNVN